MVRVHAIAGSSRYGYYLELDAAERAYWAGRDAEVLKLKNPVEPREFELLRQGIDPNTGEVLRPRQRHDLWDSWSGKRYAQQRGCYDLVVMAPKTAAIAALYDDRIVEAHKATVWSLHEAIEQYAQVRVRTGAAHETNERLATQNMVAGVWLHRNSRALDPLLHSHIAVVNLTQAPDGVWRALQAVEMYRHRQELSEEYRVRMAGELFAMGYRIERREYQGQEVGFEIGGVSGDLMKRFSQRSEERDEAIERYRMGHDGEQPTARIIAELVRQNREPKQLYSQVDAEEIRVRQMERIMPTEDNQLRQTVDQAMRQSDGYVPTHRNRPDVSEKYLPWMAFTEGIRGLDQRHRESAWKSYQNWEHKGRYGFENYVAYVQKRWRENPELLTEWQAKQTQFQGHKKRLRIDDAPSHDSGPKWDTWTYGERIQM